jgi:hypothetical protein
MAAINWLVVVLAAAAAALVMVALGRRRLDAPQVGKLFAAMLVSSAMLGHAYARIGTGTLAAKPWLYPMQSGGLALAFVIPALWVSGTRLRDALPWLGAYLAMGAVFWLAG